MVRFKLFNIGELVADLIVDLDVLRAKARRSPPDQRLTMALPSLSKLLISQKSHHVLQEVSAQSQEQAQARF